jgi:hypothetical protein
MASQHLLRAHEHPPLGAMVAITDRGAEPYTATVDSHVGRYFFAGGHRFHVADDHRASADRPIWRTAAAVVELLNPEDAALSPAAVPVSITPCKAWQPAAPEGPAEPTEEW